MDFFYVPEISGEIIPLPSDEVHHVTRVLRKQVGDELYLLDGIGGRFRCAIQELSKKNCLVKILEETRSPKPSIPVSIAIAPTKNSSRFEWFLEKATEIGVQQIFPLICQRSERRHWKNERWTKVLIAAMKQSGRSWLPILAAPTTLAKSEELKELLDNFPERAYIAHCLETETRTPLAVAAATKAGEKLVMIGPEGDFSATEVAEALKMGVQEVSLGESRLRTETAGIVACHTINLLETL